MNGRPMERGGKIALHEGNRTVTIQDPHVQHAIVLAAISAALGLFLWFSLRTGKTIPMPMVFHREDNSLFFWSIQGIAVFLLVNCLLGIAENLASL
jgi:hypothetical protein